MIGLRKIKPAFFLRLGLGLMFVYSGLDLIRHPAAWDWAVRSLPDSAQTLVAEIGVKQFLFGQGLLELALAAIFLGWFWSRRLVRLAALVAAVELTAILWLVGVDLTTFRDVGLLGAALALVWRRGHQSLG